MKFHGFVDRQKYLGASEVPFVLSIKYPDLPPTYRTAYDVWLDKTQRTKSSLIDRSDYIKSGSERLWLGKLFEEPIAFEVADRLDIIALKNPQKGYIHPFHSFIKAHIDYEFENKEGEECLLEIKTVDSRARSIVDWGGEGSSDVPYYVLIQVLVQLACAQKQKAIVGCCLGFTAIKHYVIELNDELSELQDEVIETAAQFWHKHVQTDTPPPLTANVDTNFYALRRNNVINKKSVTLPLDALDWHSKLCAAKEERKQAEKMEKLYKSKILEVMGDAGAAESPLGDFVYERRIHKKNGWTLNLV